MSATPGVEHVQSISRNNLSIAYVWLAWGTDLNGAQTLVQQQVQFAMAAVPKSLGVIPPFVLQFDPTNAPVLQVTVSGGGLTGPQLYDYAMNYIEPLLEGIPGVASAAPNGGTQRQINVIVDRAAAQSRGVTAEDISRRRRPVERAAALRRVHLAGVRRERLHGRRPAPREDDRRRAREGRSTGARSTSATSRGWRTGAPHRRRPCR